ncbi:hypothetical protein CFBP7129_25795 (plasmid) [Agrobacterium tumefaciens]|uniref:Uncharacterized protein n=1 Tax=Agrobacterium tumefaciens TaxID=358 RepID=A0A4D7Z524_AGRTU|nr:hypothetical protein CFBP7129_25795 [Agrobacterium tumefaciens]
MRSGRTFSWCPWRPRRNRKARLSGRSPRAGPTFSAQVDDRYVRQRRRDRFRVNLTNARGNLPAPPLPANTCKKAFGAL